jgi:serine/threonine-protein kinase
MANFPELPKSFYPNVYLEETDAVLPKKIDHNLHYAYFKVIAKGGKCLVQSCKDLNLGRYICYKSLLPEFADDAKEQKRFIREARVTAMLQHPNTIPTYELGRDLRGHPYFTMKLVHGYTLREVLDYRERYDLTQMMEVVMQVAHALEYAHTHGVVHRDIKPENILVGPYGEVLVMDWGLAKVWNEEQVLAPEDDPMDDTPISQIVSSITMQGKLEGTLCYMSPEQINRDPDINGRSDIFSLGAIMYEMLTGRTPSDGNTADEIIRQTREVTPELPSSLTRIRIPQRLEDITMKCLVKDPDQRLQSAAELLRMLQEGWSLQ